MKKQGVAKDILKRNARLEKELAVQKRELQIEQALDKVRSRSLSMRKSDELNKVVAVLFRALQDLDFGVDKGAAVVMTYTPGSKDHTQWIADARQTYAVPFFVAYTDHPISRDIFEGRTNRTRFFSRLYKPREKNSYFNYLFRNTDYRRVPRRVKNMILESKAYVISIAFEKNSAILIPSTSGQILSKEEKTILKRFAKVFEQSYTRFLDLQKAEAQAKEAQIQLALERVRARTMAMQKSEELNEVVKVVFEQMNNLGFDSFMISLNLYDRVTRSYECITSADPETLLPQGSYHTPYLDHPFQISLIESQEEGIPYKVFELSGKTKKTYDKLYFTLTDWKNLPVTTKQMMMGIESCTMSCAFMNYGLFNAIGDKPLSDEHAAILHRFAKVFEQTYTRFLDLQRSEAQAREAQIEAALERVRSCSLAMHKSDELKNVVVVVFEKFKELNLKFDVAGIQFFKEGSREIVQWVVAPELVSAPVLVNLPYVEKDYMESEIIRDIWAAKEEGKKIYNKQYSFNEKNKFFQYAARYNDFAAIPQEVREFQLRAPAYTYTLISNKHSGLWLDSYSGQTISVEEYNILERFARVFEQAYVRFLDLQKAEAQAREAQIEASLERVRARSLAMHKSDELSEASTVLFQELTKLGIQTSRSGFGIYDEGENVIRLWLTANAGDRAVRPVTGNIPLSAYPAITNNYNAWKERKLMHIQEFIGSGVGDYYQAIGKYLSLAPQAQYPDRLVFSVFFFNEGSLNVMTENPLTEEECAIMLRFAKVFGFAYTRFLDLQKVEAQAREAQIELGLERVRARAMAMQSSSELSELVAMLFDELVKLDLVLARCIIWIFDEETLSANVWMANSEDKRIAQSYFIKRLDHPYYKAIIKAWKEKKPKWIYDLKGANKRSIDDLLLNETELSNLPETVKAGIRSAKHTSISGSFHNFGFIEASGPVAHTEEQLDILHRFGKVFDLSYTRFNDLQKAETRAREAQIEAALERVRSRSMAMHESSDLHEVLKVVTEQLLLLGIKFNVASFAKIGSEGSWDLWISTPEQSYPSVVHVPYIDHRLFNDLAGVISQRLDFFTDVYGKEEKDIFFKHFFENTLARETPAARKEYVMNSRGFARSVFLTQNIWFSISNYDGVPYADGENAIFKRFANVFEQSYTRFLDLQRAEANARESQIESSLERVRSKTMAMHNSADVGETVAVLFDELKKLGIETIRCGIGIMQHTKNMEVWTAKPNEKNKIDLIIGHLDMNLHPLLQGAFNGWSNKKESFSYELKGDDLIDYFAAINRHPGYPVQYDIATLPSAIYHNDFYFSEGTLFAFSLKELSDETKKICKRFAGVFGQTYRRYLDLQKAEAQAREAQIEAALERVRARTMAMHESVELLQTADLLFDQLKLLGAQLQGVAFSICDANSTMVQKWTSIGVFSVPYTIEPGEQGMYEAWKNHQEIYEEVYEGERIRKYYELFMEIPAFKEGIQKFIDSGHPLPTWQKNHAVPFKHGYLLLITTEEFAETQIFVRFAKVFEQTYTRFLDLQRAETQARESQIQLALERVRASTMAMHRSEDLAGTAQILFHQLQELGEIPDRMSIGIADEAAGVVNFWSTDQFGSHINNSFKARLNEQTVISKTYQAWKEQKKSLVIELQGEELKEWIRFAREEMNIAVNDDFIKDRRVHNLAFFSHGWLLVTTHELQSPEAIQILERFASVFNLTYRRFLDLKKAEAQAREAQIEAGLERVRARTMAMFKSDELAETAAEVFKQMNGLGIIPNRLYIVIINDDSGNMEFWITDENGEKIGSRHPVNIDDNISLKAMFEGWTLKRKSIIVDQQGNELHAWLKYWKEKFHIAFKNDTIIKRRVQTIAYFSRGFIAMASPDDQSQETIQLLERFAAVFNLTYTRFSDLQQAEAQAKEATIEAALEKVRGKAMAMHNSNDLSATASMVFTELRKLGISPIRCGFGALSNETLKAPLYSATSSENGDQLALVGWVVLEGHPTLEKIYQSWSRGEDYFPELKGDELRSYYKNLLKGLSVPVPDWKDEQVQYGHFIAFKVGCLYAWSDRRYTEEEIRILKRFATIIDLTFRRYLELQQSEANAREAVKQAALDRIRADIASMRTVDDLERITPLIWNELTILGIPFIRCGVFIMDDSQRFIHTFLSTPDGKAIAAFHIPYSTPGNIQKVIGHWQNDKKYIDHWDESDFTQFADILVRQNALASPEAYLKTIPHGGFYLHFLPFLQGMLYVGNTTQLSEDDIQLIQSVADAFSTAYARYEDFNKLEAAKKQVDAALNELQATQKQLIQSEKMASLGELTAGIAHEIQNPLNFVNNFSDVNKELVEELKTCLSGRQVKNEKSKIDDAQINELLHDISQNLEKINHHGRRADAIVKGMLQHSRTSSGQKELADLNALCDEYLRLAYHGLRAKDKSFNAKFETNFDSNVGQINIIPQDIGRVLLNLINNAFYAVSEKKKQAPNGYEPTVTLTTTKENGKIELRVKDNGNGIPGTIVDKIFQPFFTTKPTGQGTGLGLSLSYDIVKAHGGEIKVETKEGEGSEFIIRLETN